MNTTLNEWLGQIKSATSPSLIPDISAYTPDGHPTWAAMLLFAKEPIRHHVHIGRFKTPDMIIDDRQFTDTLFEVVEQSMKFIVSHISVAFEFDGSIQRKERFAYPLPAVREALLNAIVHRSYTGVMATFAQKQPELPDEGVNEGVNSLTNLIRKQPGLRAPALAAALQTSPKNIERWLKQLKENGLIEFKGAAKTGGYHAAAAKPAPPTGSNKP